MGGASFLFIHLNLLYTNTHVAQCSHTLTQMHRSAERRLPNTKALSGNLSSRQPHDNWFGAAKSTNQVSVFWTELIAFFFYFWCCWIERFDDLTRMWCFFLCFFFFSSTKTSPFILHTRSIRIFTYTYADDMHAHKHTHSLTGHILHSTVSIAYFVFLSVSCYLISSIQSLIASLSLFSQCVFVSHYLVHIVRGSLFE